MSETDGKKEVKHKFALWVKDSSMELVERSRSEFIEKAINFYSGYLAMKNNEQYISNMVTSTMKSIIDESDNRISRMIFKVAVELAMTMNIIAATNDIDETSLSRLRGECIKEVKKHNGTL